MRKKLKEYKPLKIPEGMSEGLLFSMASSKQLDVFGGKVGIQRRSFFIFKEPDFLFKIRIRNKNIQLKHKETK